MTGCYRATPMLAPELLKSRTPLAPLAHLAALVTALLLAACATPPKPASQAPNAPSETRGAHDAAIWAMAFLGVPYKPGGNTTEGFDCSGFTRHVFNHSLGVLLPRRAEQQAQDAGLPFVARDDLAPGDLVFFNTQNRAFSHVGIYVGKDRFVHSPREGAAVRMESMRVAYWEQRFEGGRRVTARSTGNAQPNARTMP
jgi:cell wall-associated NlpC family hydrolase